MGVEGVGMGRRIEIDMIDARVECGRVGRRVGRRVGVFL